MCGAKHVPLVVYRRPWRFWRAKEFWIVCWECDWRLGPYDEFEARVLLEAKI